MLLEITNLKRGLGACSRRSAPRRRSSACSAPRSVSSTPSRAWPRRAPAVSPRSALVSPRRSITTAFGLLVAIPAVWAYNYFQTKIDNLTAEMTYVSKEMIDYLIKGVSGEFGRSRFTREFNASSGTNAPIST